MVEQKKELIKDLIVLKDVVTAEETEFLSKEYFA